MEKVDRGVYRVLTKPQDRTIRELPARTDCGVTRAIWRARRFYYPQHARLPMSGMMVKNMPPAREGKSQIMANQGVRGRAVVFRHLLLDSKGRGVGATVHIFQPSA